MGTLFQKGGNKSIKTGVEQSIAFGGYVLFFYLIGKSFARRT